LCLALKLNKFMCFLPSENKISSYPENLYFFLNIKEILVCGSLKYVKFVPRHNGMVRPQVGDGGDGLQVQKVAANIFNKQSRTADRGWSSSLGIGQGASNLPP
jgi:hypothetical protein